MVSDAMRETEFSGVAIVGSIMFYPLVVFFRVSSITIITVLVIWVLEMRFFQYTKSNGLSLTKPTSRVRCTMTSDTNLMTC